MDFGQPLLFQQKVVAVTHSVTVFFLSEFVFSVGSQKSFQVPKTLPSLTTQTRQHRLHTQPEG